MFFLGIRRFTSRHTVLFEDPIFYKSKNSVVLQPNKAIFVSGSGIWS